MDKRLTIIDFSSLLYSVSYNCKVNELETDNFTFYKETLDLYVNTILEETEATHYICFGDGKTSFRKEAFKEFKADRVAKPKAKFINDLFEYAQQTWLVYTSNSLEADDMCLIYATEVGNTEKETTITIASKDSDLRQYPGLFYNYGYRRDKKYKATYADDFEGDPVAVRKELAEAAFEKITPAQAEYNLYKQVLMKGHNNKIDYLEGCGEVTADAYLTQFPINKRENALNAFIYGIKKTNTIKRCVKGYGFYKGIEKFFNAFKQSYLLRTLDEAAYLGAEWVLIPPMIEIVNPDTEDEW